MFELIDVEDLKTLSIIIDGELIGENKPFTSLITDSRKAKKNSVFLALQGEDFDGHNFCESAIHSGSIAYISNKKINNHDGIVVQDTYIALLKLAKFQQEKVKPKTLAITGSNGKTTVKEMMAFIFKDQQNIVTTNKNDNNQFGVPFTVLRLKNNTKYLVLECGARKIGDFDLISEYLYFDVVAITNVNNSHIGIFKNQQNIIKTKIKLLDGLVDHGSVINGAFENLNSPTQFMKNDQGYKVTTHANSDSSEKPLKEEFLCRATADHTPGRYRLLIKKIDGENSQSMEMQGIGTFGAVHNCHNALIAAVAATELGKGFSDSIAQICKYVSPLRDRFFIEKMGKHLLIDDTYNANPSSFSSAINDLSNNSAYPKNKLLVIGDMLELGEFSREEHLRILKESLKVPGLKALFIEGNRFKKALFEYGNNDEEEKIFVIDPQESFPIKLISQFLDEETTILVKGSRGMKLERIISLFVENFS